MSAIRLSKEQPGFEEYRVLRVTFGLSPKSQAAAEIGAQQPVCYNSPGRRL